VFLICFPKNLFFLPRLPGCITSVSQTCLYLPSSSFCRNFWQALQQCLALIFTNGFVMPAFAAGLHVPTLTMARKFSFLSFPSFVLTLTCCVAHSSVHLFLVAYHAFYKKLVRSLPAVLMLSQRLIYAIFWCRFYSSPDYSHQRSFLSTAKLSARSPNSCAFCA